MIITTTNNVEGHQISSYLGVVSSKSTIGDTVLISGKPKQQLLFDEAISLALQGLQEKAENLGANALIGVNIATENCSAGNTLFLATGTAVMID